MKIANKIKPTVGTDNYYHFVYRIEHTVTGKFYIGRHSTKNLGDGYRGSGTNIKKMFELFNESEFKLLRLKFFSCQDDCMRFENELLNIYLLYEKCLNVARGTAVPSTDKTIGCACGIGKEEIDKAFDGLREYGKVPDAYTEDLLILAGLSSKALLAWSFLIRTRHLDYIRDWKSLTNTRWNLRSVYGVSVDLHQRGLCEDLKRILNVRTDRSIRRILKELVDVNLLANTRPKTYVVNPFHFFRGTKLAHQVCRENWLTLQGE